MSTADYQRVPRADICESATINLRRLQGASGGYVVFHTRPGEADQQMHGEAGGRMTRHCIAVVSRSDR